MYFKSIIMDDYELINSQNLFFKTEALKYLNNNLDCLYKFIYKVNKQVILNYNVNKTDNLTISLLILKIFLSNYYNNNILLLTKLSIYRDIK